MKRIFLSGIVLTFAFLLSACGAKSTQDAISKELGIDVSEGEEISNYDTHSGNGDGASCVAIRFDGDAILEGIEGSAGWKEFPLDTTVQSLVYGVSDAASSIGPYLNDENGSPLVPEIRDGYYLLIDRHSDKGADILDRGSFNFTLGLYDADTHTLYFCKLDT